jgi:hypothetical protein
MLIYRILSLLHTEMGGKKDKLTQILEEPSSKGNLIIINVYKFTSIIWQI